MSKFRTFAKYRDGNIELHVCPGFWDCKNHPRWHVVKDHGQWVVYPPRATSSFTDFRTHAEAINYAQKEATK